MDKTNPLSPGKAWRLFGNYLRQKGLRVTHPRRIICDSVCRHEEHFTAEELATELGGAGPSRVSRATVYQTLGLMVKAGLVSELREAGRRVVYDRRLGFEDHEHLVCECCGSFIEFLDPEIHRRIQRACEEADFQERDHRITILGLCRRCRVSTGVTS